MAEEAAKAEHEVTLDEGVRGHVLEAIIMEDFARRRPEKQNERRSFDFAISMLRAGMASDPVMETLEIQIKSLIYQFTYRSPNTLYTRSSTILQSLVFKF